jgi:hypothetical protein
MNAVVAKYAITADGNHNVRIAEVQVYANITDRNLFV